MSEPKVTVLPYISPRCVVCGRDLPKGRRQKCYSCRPPKVYKPPADPAPDQEYTLEDRVAQAEAYGLSYDEDESSPRLGLVKQFANGIYIGNSAPRLSTGSFVGLMGAVGFFVNTQEGRSYNVLNEELYDAFTAVFA